MSKKRPLNFQAPSFAEAGPPPMVEEGHSLGMPPVPAPEVPQPQPEPALLPDPSRFASQPQKRVQTPARKVEPAMKHIYLLALVATVLWAGGLVAYTIGLRERVGPFEAEPFAIVILAVLGLAPLGLIWVGAYALRQGARLMAEVNRLEALSNDMLAPAAMAAAEVGSAVQAIRKEIQSAVSAADAVLELALQHAERLPFAAEVLHQARGGVRRAGGHLDQPVALQHQQVLQMH